LFAPSKSGLPLNDGIRLIATESPEPVKGEFRRIVESQQVGLSIPDAALRMSETMPCAEARLLWHRYPDPAAGRRQSVGSLGNLSRVLRDRKKMKAKVQALSMEAKASAASSARCLSWSPFSSICHRLRTSCRCSPPRPAT
jgi:tight adherence protein B